MKAIMGRLSQGPGAGVIATGVFLLLWELGVRLFEIPAYLLPRPAEIAAEMWKHRAVLLRDTWVTGYEIAVGFLLGALIGFALAVLVIFSPIVERVVMPAAVLTQIIPKLAVAPLFVVWFGVGFVPKIAITALMAVFPVLINGVAGLSLVDRRWLELMHSVSASRWDVFRKVRLPNSAPYVFVGLKVGMTLCVVGAIVGEWMGANAGLGFQIMLSISQLQTPLLFGCLLLLSVLGIGFFGLISLAEALVLPRHRRVSARDLPAA